MVNLSYKKDSEDGKVSGCNLVYEQQTRKPLDVIGSEFLLGRQKVMQNR